jgi:hypothetical protein
LAESERKGDLKTLIEPSRYLTIGPDALKSHPEASLGHQQPSGVLLGVGTIPRFMHLTSGHLSLDRGEGIGDKAETARL